MEAPITLITGTRKGIGYFLAQYYSKAGHIVIGCSRHTIDWELPHYEHYQVDVANEEQVKLLFSSIRKKYQRLDNLINNAGIASMNHALVTPISTVEKVLNTNVIGTFLFCREGAKLMKKNHYGRIVNFTTIAVPLKLAGEAIYVASKAAVLSLTEVLAKEFADLGITVNAVGPVPIETDLIRAVPPAKIQALLNQQAIKRFGTFEDVANVIDFFLRPESNFITGQHLYLGGV
ncbi:SDR family oxidoreductase [Spirulina subsalsa FACHB-351]|uniref:SDR family oxidoreductase n=1 Tax=Spirulina subsalsa FACHB-351 TaxID=234711 RepID=A0ABT3L4B9_9CYAN|nr:SDR family oxidoreductase [Spirulina subsalsa]MCW6035949.1 SDR family oxidoreductase [Spirulina subsalsa FACHB-351]